MRSLANEIESLSLWAYARMPASMQSELAQDKQDHSPGPFSYSGTHTDPSSLHAYFAEGP